MLIGCSTASHRYDGLTNVGCSENMVVRGWNEVERWLAWDVIESGGVGDEGGKVNGRGQRGVPRE